MLNLSKKSITLGVFVVTFMSFGLKTASSQGNNASQYDAESTVPLILNRGGLGGFELVNTGKINAMIEKTFSALEKNMERNFTKFNDSLHKGMETFSALEKNMERNFTKFNDSLHKEMKDFKAALEKNTEEKFKKQDDSFRKKLNNIKDQLEKANGLVDRINEYNNYVIAMAILLAPIASLYFAIILFGLVWCSLKVITFCKRKISNRCCRYGNANSQQQTDQTSQGCSFLSSIARTISSVSRKGREI